MVVFWFGVLGVVLAGKEGERSRSGSRCRAHHMINLDITSTNSLFILMNKEFGNAQFPRTCQEENNWKNNHYIQ